MTEAAADRRLWPIIVEMTNAEERVFAHHSNVNLKTMLVQLSAVEDEQDELKQKVLIVDTFEDPFVKPALILVAAKRENPTVTIDEVIRHLDAGLWDLDYESLSATDENGDVIVDVEGEAVLAPLAPPPATLSAA